MPLPSRSATCSRSRLTAPVWSLSTISYTPVLFARSTVRQWFAASARRTSVAEAAVEPDGGGRDDLAGRRQAVELLDDLEPVLSSSRSARAKLFEATRIVGLPSPLRSAIETDRRVTPCTSPLP